MNWLGHELPEWANWIARNEDCAVYAFEHRPVCDTPHAHWGVSANVSCAIFVANELNSPVDWRDSLVDLSKLRKQPAISDSPCASDFLGKAQQHMLDRAATYDKPEGERSMEKTVAVFNAFHGTSLTEAQGWHLLQILKDVRLFARSGLHIDSAEDCCAYAALKAEAKAKELGNV